MTLVLAVQYWWLFVTAARKILRGYVGGIFGLFSGNFDGIDKSILAAYPGLLEYHDRVANESRIAKHYANIAECSLRWTYQPNAFADLI